MRKLVLVLILMTFVDRASALVPKSCSPEDAPVIQKGGTVEAFILLEKIRVLAPKNPMSLGQWEGYLALKEQMLNSSDKSELMPETIQIKQLCDMHPLTASLDPVLRNRKGPLRQYHFQISQSNAHQFLSKQANVIYHHVIRVHGRIIGNCPTDDIFNCSEIYQVEIEGVDSNVNRAYQTGGASTAGGN